VNKEIQVFNRKLHKVVKTADNAKIIHADLSGNDFTHHGLHLNTSGKGNMAKLIGDNINTPFILKWEENQKDPAQKDAKEKLTNDVTKEHNLKEVRTSKRKKRNPATGNKDFLWITGN
jgi:hypothetical protein